MISQPRGLKRRVTYASFPLKIRERLDTISAVNDVRRSFVITKYVAEALGISGEGFDYEDYIAKRTPRARRNKKARRVK